MKHREQFIMNKKGQVLVLFILLLPLIFIFLYLVVDIGLMYIEKGKMQNNVKEIITQELKCEECPLNEKETRIRNLINKNIDGVSYDTLEVNDNYIKVSISKDYKSIFVGLFKKDDNKIKVSYKGYMENNKITIKKE